MTNLTISIFGKKIFLDILNEIKLFSNIQTKYYEDLEECLLQNGIKNQVIVVFLNYLNKDLFKEKNITNIPILLIEERVGKKNSLNLGLNDELIMPFSILDFYKKVISLSAKAEFKKNSLINLNGYLIDKNERKIKKNNIELQLSEKEINFLILFSENQEPINKNLVLKKVWNYSLNTETHTVETHIHRLRKKILKKFNDDNFIKNNNKGYYI
jgi:DNA-binding response OmpR family regulator